MPGVKAAIKVAGKGAGRGTSAAGASATTKALPSDLPPDPGTHSAKLRAQGRDDAQIRKALTDMGYPAATARNIAPGNARTATSETAEPTSPAPGPAVPTGPPARSSAPTTGRTLPTPGAGDLSGFVLGLLGTAILVNFMRGGTAQVKQWARAKFLNDATGNTPATPLPRAGPGGSAPIPGQPKYTSPDGGKNFDPAAGAGSSGV